jgi:uncharacterized membrane protein YcaP (DUF421 family)
MMEQLLAALQLAVGEPMSLLFTALRVIVIYLVLLLALRLTGRRQLGQLTPFDLLTLLLLSNVVQNAMIGPDNSLTGGLIGAFILLGLNRLVARNPRLRRGLEGDPIMLVFQGRVLQDRLWREGVSQSELETAVREHGVADLTGVETAVLEMDGTISIIPKAGVQAKQLKRVVSRRSH